MSSLPTLLKPGYLLPQKWMSKSEVSKLENQIPIEYILNYISDRTPDRKGGQVKISPKTPGDKVIVLKASTGSGKSTSFPVYLYNHYKDRIHKNIVITQPRVLSCVDIPQNILQWAKELEFDKNIGYNTKNFKRLPKEKGIIYCTTEIITQQLLMAETPKDFMKQYQFIIIDEIHVRDLAIDRLLFIIKKLITEFYSDPECPMIILTSATFDENLFIDYFEVPIQNYIMVEGFVHPTVEFWPKYNIIDCNTYAVKKTLQIHIDNIADVIGDESGTFRDIIIFVAKTKVGQKMVEDILHYNSTVLRQEFDQVLSWKKKVLDKEIDELHIKNNNPNISGGKDKAISKASRFYLLPVLLTSSTYEAGGLEYQNMFSSIETISLPIWDIKPGERFDIHKKPDRYVIPSRRVIIGTNVAETGITINTLKYCIDTGYVNSIEYIPDYASKLVCQKGCTQGMVIQRKGRVGRLSPGFWFPCFTKETFNLMQKDQYADIITSDPIDNMLTIFINESETKIVEESSQVLIRNENLRTNACLFQKNYISDPRWWKVQSNKQLNIGIMDFLESPSASAIEYSVERLHKLGMIDTYYNITLFGLISDTIRFIPVYAKKMIFSGFASGASILDLVTATAFIETGKTNIYDDTYKTPNMIGKNNYIFINNVLIGDELIESILLYNEFNEWISLKLKKLFVSYKGKWTNSSQFITLKTIKEWCSERGILYPGWISMISNRNNILDNLISVGINVHYNTAGIHPSKYNLKQILSTNLNEGLEEVKKIKEAIYNGYYSNLCEWNEIKKTYILLAKNVPIAINSHVVPYINPRYSKQSKPQYIVVSDYSLQRSKNSVLFEFNGYGYISVMDNYISVDPKLGIA